MVMGNTRLPPMWPVFESQRGLPLLRGFFVGVLWFSSLTKTNISKFQFDQETVEEPPCGLPLKFCFILLYYINPLTTGLFFNFSNS